MLSGEQRGTDPNNQAGRGRAARSKARTHSTLSANCLFHFTRYKENLMGILEDNFYPQYALENMNFAGTKIADRHRAIPMVSFCDIPLSQVRDHVEAYGEYALGLTKAWGRSQGIAPVLYAHSTGVTSRSMWKVFELLSSSLASQNLEELSGLERNIAYFSYYIKRYSGKRYRNGRYVGRAVRFYDEREWRYIPPLDLLVSGQVNAFLFRGDFDNKEIRRHENKRIASICKLKFEPKYVKYVIVRSEDEILEIMDTILRMKGPNFGYDDVRRMTSRILTTKDILEDF